MVFSLDLVIIFKKITLDLELDSDLNQKLFLKELVFDNKQGAIILCVRIKIFITIGYTFDMKCFKKL